MNPKSNSGNLRYLTPFPAVPIEDEDDDEDDYERRGSRFLVLASLQDAPLDRNQKPRT